MSWCSPPLKPANSQAEGLKDRGEVQVRGVYGVPVQWVAVVYGSVVWMDTHFRATYSTIVLDTRGAKALLGDDFLCLVNSNPS